MGKALCKKPALFKAESNLLSFWFGSVTAPRATTRHLKLPEPCLQKQRLQKRRAGEELENRKTTPIPVAKYKMLYQVK